MTFESIELTLTTQPALTFFIFAILGACVGSFLNVVIYRIPHNINISSPSSSCPLCKKKLLPHHNIPLFSYLFLRAKCGFCRKEISCIYFFVELFCATIFGGVACLMIHYQYPFLTIAKFLILFCLLLVLFFIDLKYKYLPDKITYTGMIIGVITLFFPSSNLINQSFTHHLASGVYSYFLIFLIIKMGKLITKKQIMGYGDAKLMALVGLFLGLWLSLLTLLFASLFGLIYFIMSKKKVIAFGSFLAVSCLFVYLCHIIFQNVNLRL